MSHGAWSRFGLCVVLAACGGGGAGDDGGCSGSCGTAAPTALSAVEVQTIVRQAVNEAQARNAPAIVAVVDRVGNVLAVFRMNGAPASATVQSGRPVSGGLEGAVVPSELAALSKALTAAYLSSEGNAFSTRTAGQIIQEHFNPGEPNAPSGPLFGVQFSSLTCSDVVLVSSAPGAGPKGSPLGLAADPGGLPLYKSGVLVGGVGVIADGVYGIDRDISDVDHDTDELIAVAASIGFGPSDNRRADRISVDGRTLRYVDSEDVAANPAAAPAFSALPGTLVALPGLYSAATINAGVAYGTTASGVRADTSGAFAGLNAFVLDDGAGNARFAPIGGTDGLLATAEVTTILREALRLANRARAQIRRPLGSHAEVSIAIVDTTGAILGLIRTPDAPLFGADVAVQKARTALLFSHPAAAAQLAPAGPYASAMQSLIPGALTDGRAYTSRAVANLARPFLPDGIDGQPPGPLSKPYNQWSPFSVGLALDLVMNRLVANLAGPTPGDCTSVTRARNGIQIFPGGVPIYRGTTLVGAIGVSGDGVDQDDMIAFAGLANGAALLATGVGNAPATMRADQVVVPGGHLRYTSCPVAPLLDSDTSDVCAGL
jgi:uncharacterized protein GlcG (DUF336 family)